MRNAVLTEDGMNIRCELDSIPEEHNTHLTKGVNGRYDYKKWNPENGQEAAVLNEVHIYCNTNATFGPSTIPLSNVEKIEVIEKDLKRTSGNHTKVIIFSVVGGVVLIAGIGLIAAATVIGAL
jgi:hypothetical protein